MNLTLTNRVHVIEPQDEAMEDFRKLFRLIADCHVSDDGMVMTYQMQTVAGAARWVSEAKQIITVNGMPLEPSVKAYQRKGEAAPYKVELRIVYMPKEAAVTETTMPVGYAEHHPAINLEGINPHLQHAFAGITY